VPRSRLRVRFTSVLFGLSLLQLVLPPNLLGGCLQRVVALSARAASVTHQPVHMLLCQSIRVQC
jgi:hypothetical protein